MSIYATQWILQFPKTGDSYHDCEWIEVIGQGVPAHIGTPTQGHGYQGGDPYGSFLPPAIPVGEDETSGQLRAIVIVKNGTEKVGQEYIGPLLVLSGADYARIPLQELHDRICDALRGARPRLVAEAFGADGDSRRIFEDGSVSSSKREDE